MTLKELKERLAQYPPEFDDRIVVYCDDDFCGSCVSPVHVQTIKQKESYLYPYTPVGAIMLR